jgi:hypothetical protein
MPLSPHARAAQYRDYAADLRRLADRTHADIDRQQLVRLADKFELLAGSHEQTTLAAVADIPLKRILP